MQKMNEAVYRAQRGVWTLLLLAAWTAIWLPVCLGAVTIEDIAARNNKILELDQEIAIAEKNKKLAEIRSSAIQPEIIALPKLAAVRRDENVAVIAVHGESANPVVDVQYGDIVLQKRRGDVLPDGWQLVQIDTDTVTFRKKSGRKADMVKTVGIGLNGKSVAEKESSAALRMAPSMPLAEIPAPGN